MALKNGRKRVFKNAANGAGGQGSWEESLFAAVSFSFNFFLLACLHVV
jgi:hypothetical protein